MVKDGVKITEVAENSIGAQAGLQPGDILLRVGGEKLLDMIDYLWLTSEERLNLEVLKVSGEISKINLRKAPEESLGLSFEDVVFDGTRHCQNHCLFCFVDQLPRGQRPSLYIKDDDYRLSFLQGSYITLTNLTENDWQRIERLHLSPLYISVHATDRKAREKLLGAGKAGNILDYLKRLGDAGITVHTQAVICPGINDGPILEQTMEDLKGLRPSVASLAIVPVGLTRYGSGGLRLFTKEEADAILTVVHRFQERNIKDFGSRFVFAADEWYIIARQSFPEDLEYEDYPQLDNGVGLIRWFLTEFKEAFKRKKHGLRKVKANLAILTGESTGFLWKEVNACFRESAPGVRLEVLPVVNEFFGPSVNVTGLLAGADLMRAIQNHDREEEGFDERIYLIPQITLKKDEDVFLDNITVNRLKELCYPKRVEIVPTRAEDWLEWILHLA